MDGIKYFCVGLDIATQIYYTVWLQVMLYRNGNLYIWYDTIDSTSSSPQLSWHTNTVKQVEQGVDPGCLVGGRVVGHSQWQRHKASESANCSALFLRQNGEKGIHPGSAQQEVYKYVLATSGSAIFYFMYIKTSVGFLWPKLFMLLYKLGAFGMTNCNCSEYQEFRTSA